MGIVFRKVEVAQYKSDVKHSAQQITFEYEYVALPEVVDSISSKLLVLLNSFFEDCNMLSRNVTLVSDVVTTARVPPSHGGQFELISKVGEIQVRGDHVFIFLMEFDEDHSVGVQRVLSGGGFIWDALPRGERALARQWELPTEMATRESRFLLQNRFVKSTLRSTALLDRGTSGHMQFHWGIHETICEAIELTRDVPGAYVEIGILAGGSAATARMYMGSAGIKRNMSLIDTFQGFTYDSIKNSGDSWWTGDPMMKAVWHSPAAWIHKVRQLLTGLDLQQPFFSMHKRDIVSQDLPQYIKQVAVANIDCDIYEAILASLEKLAPLVPKGGILIMDDVLKLPDLSGARAAMDFFLSADVGKSFAKVYKRYTVWLIQLA